MADVYASLAEDGRSDVPLSPSVTGGGEADNTVAAAIPVLPGFAVQGKSGEADGALAGGGPSGGALVAGSRPRGRTRSGARSSMRRWKLAGEEMESASEYINADAIYNESKLEPYQPHADYLDMAIQFGYVLMFSIVWPFCPFCALINNFLEIRGDAFRLMFLRRRPVPRKAANIGHWERVFKIQIVLAIFVATGIFVLGTGQLEQFLWSADPSFCPNMTKEVEQINAVYKQEGLRPPGGTGA